MAESIISILGSIASILGLVLVVREKNSTTAVQSLIGIVVLLSCSTSYLIFKNSKYESARYQEISQSFFKSMEQQSVEREARALLSTLPIRVHSFNTGDNEGIIYGVLAFLEKHKAEYPELYEQFKTNILSDIEEAKSTRGSPNHHKILESGANASIRMLSSMAGENEN